MPNALKALFDPEYWKSAQNVAEGYADTAKNSLAHIIGPASHLSQGITTGIVGAPVDIANMALQPFGLGSEMPIGGSNHLASLINADTRNLPYQVGTMLPVGPEGLIAGAKGIPLALAGIFAGRGAKTADLLKLSKAQEMAKAGIPDAQIWKETGWTLDTPDKMPRFEIPDNAAKWKANKLLLTDPSGSLQGNVMNHPDLYGAYDHLQNLDVVRGERPGGSYIGTTVNGEPMLGQVTLGSDVIKKAPDGNFAVSPDTAKSINLHELQHAIQHREGFARGGSPDSAWVDAGVYEDFAKKKINEMNKYFWSKEGQAMTKAQKDAYKSEMHRVDDLANTYANDSTATYKALAGEAEARLTQSRMNLTPEQRLMQYPYEPGYFEQATGVPLNSLIVRHGDGVANSISKTDIPDYGQTTGLKPLAEDVPVKGLSKFENATPDEQALALEEWAKQNGVNLQRTGASEKSDSLYYVAKRPKEYDPEYGWMDYDTAHIRLSQHPNQTNTADYLNAIKSFNIYPEGDSLTNSADDLLLWINQGEKMPKDASAMSTSDQYSALIADTKRKLGMP